jgi:hypothetical protein
LCAAHPQGQVDERIDARMMALNDRRLEEPSRPVPNAVKQLVEGRASADVGRQPGIGMTDRTVGS